MTIKSIRNEMTEINEKYAALVLTDKEDECYYNDLLIFRAAIILIESKIFSLAVDHDLSLDEVEWLHEIKTKLNVEIAVIESKNASIN